MTRARKDWIFGFVIGMLLIPLGSSFVSWAIALIGKIIGGG